MENGLQMTLGEWMPEAFPNQIVGALDSHARTSVSADCKEGSLKETAQACFSQLWDFLDKPQKKKDPTPYSLRTLKICFLLMEGGTLPDFSLKWTNVGTMRNGKFSIQKTSVYHTAENGSLLSDILEPEVSSKYFVSERGGYS